LKEKNEKFKALYHEYFRMIRSLLFRVCGRESLDDLTQESFLKVWRDLESFDSRSSVKTWVYRIAMNTALDDLRRRKRESLRITSTRVDEEAAAVAVDEGERYSEKSLIESAFGRLSDEHRCVLVLSYFEDLPLEEIAWMLNLPLGTVKSRMFHAKHHLKKILISLGVTGL